MATADLHDWIESCSMGIGSNLDAFRHTQEVAHLQEALKISEMAVDLLDVYVERYR